MSVTPMADCPLVEVWRVPATGKDISTLRLYCVLVASMRAEKMWPEE